MSKGKHCHMLMEIIIISTEALIHVYILNDRKQVISRPSGGMLVAMKKYARSPILIWSENMGRFVHCVDPLSLSNIDGPTIIHFDLVSFHVTTRKNITPLSMTCCLVNSGNSIAMLILHKVQQLESCLVDDHHHFHWYHKISSLSSDGQHQIQLFYHCNHNQPEYQYWWMNDQAPHSL